MTTQPTESSFTVIKRFDSVRLSYELALRGVTRWRIGNEEKDRRICEGETPNHPRAMLRRGMSRRAMLARGRVADCDG